MTSAHRTSSSRTVRAACELTPRARTLTDAESRQIRSAVGLRHRLRLHTNKALTRGPGTSRSRSLSLEHAMSLLQAVRQGVTSPAGTRIGEVSHASFTEMQPAIPDHLIDIVPCPPAAVTLRPETSPIGSRLRERGAAADPVRRQPGIDALHALLGFPDSTILTCNSRGRSSERRNAGSRRHAVRVDDRQPDVARPRARRHPQRGRFGELQGTVRGRTVYWATRKPARTGGGVCDMLAWCADPRRC